MPTLYDEGPNDVYSDGFDIFQAGELAFNRLLPALITYLFHFNWQDFSEAVRPTDVIYIRDQDKGVPQLR
jgi:hypothetical protein